MSRVRVSAVVMRDDHGRILTVRKRGTDAFMLPGGKPEPGEDASATAIRECREELGVDLDLHALRAIGFFEAEAANEPGWIVEAAVFEHPYVNVIAPAAEIAELSWREVTDRTVAPLLADAVFPALSGQVIPGTLSAGPMPDR